MYSKVTINCKNCKVLPSFLIKNLKLWLSFFIFLTVIGLALNPEIYIQATFEGLLVWATVVLPALLPFFMLTTMLTKLGVVNNFCQIFNPLTKFLFKAPAISSYIFFMSIISGYPVGAKLTSDCYKQGLITTTEASKITTFTSTSGPMFIIGTVGVGMLHSYLAGVIIFLSHILASIINGIFYRNFYVEQKHTSNSLKLHRFK